MTLDELITLLMEQAEHDPTVGGWPVMVDGNAITAVKRGDRPATTPNGRKTTLGPVIRLVIE